MSKYISTCLHLEGFACDMIKCLVIEVHVGSMGEVDNDRRSYSKQLGLVVLLGSYL